MEVIIDNDNVWTRGEVSEAARRSFGSMLANLAEVFIVTAPGFVNQDQGIFRDSLQKRPGKDELEIEVFSRAPHALVLEYRRRPGQAGPPFEPIRDWAVRRELTPNNPRPNATPEEAFDEMVWLIQRAIHVRGIPTSGGPPQEPFGKALTAMALEFQILGVTALSQVAEITSG